MIRIGVTSVFVDDQAKAEAFYTDVLGFQVKDKVSLGEFDWLTLVSPADVDGIQSLAIETAVLFPAALGYLLWLGSDGSGTFTSEGAGHITLLALAGVVTAVPPMLFGAAAIRIPLATVGLLQYIAPVMQFLIGVLINGEPMPPERLVGFVLVWVALVVFAGDAIRTLRRGAAVATAPPPSAEAAAAARVGA